MQSEILEVLVFFPTLLWQKSGGQWNKDLLLEASHSSVLMQNNGLMYF